MQSSDGRSVNRQVWKQYQRQKTRGKEGFGVFDGKYIVKAAMEKRIKRWFKRGRNQTGMLLFHHRFPTSTPNIKKAAHPFHTGNFFGKTRYVLVHNGVINNPDTLKEEHEKLGIKYQSVLDDGKYNDSEALLWDFALTMEGHQKELKAYGGIAFICVKMVDGKPEKLLYGRNYGRPLKVKRSKKTVMLSSEGDGTEVEALKLFTYDYGTGKTSQEHFRIPSFLGGSYSSGTYGRSKSKNTGTSGVPDVCNPSWDDDEDDDFFIGKDGKKYYRIDRDLSDDDTSFDWRDKDGNWHSSDLSQASPKDKAALIGEILKLKPKPERVKARVFTELGKAKGYYQDAYWEIMGQYYELELITKPTMKNKKEMALLMAAGENIMNDENNVDEKSQHPLWADAVKKDDSDKNQLKLVGAGA